MIYLVSKLRLSSTRVREGGVKGLEKARLDQGLTQYNLRCNLRVRKQPVSIKKAKS